ncbi:MFS transporter [Pseudolabrys taiwanensis]|uniref:MFS transporter n=1 Tax=Pseudolabrys taiwanensis TaxID=331696 RepID=A0A345ZTD9_9HYPH|nr:MFS transporter [Pseudolabrys taiwanensis]AXK80186.1 MFS transporter [Pseudolabrys taiwanensis]
MVDISVENPDAPRRGSVAVIAVTLFLNVTGFTLILPVIPFLVGRYVPPDRVGLYVGLIVSVFALCAFAAAPVLGALSDRFGRRPVLLLSLIGSAIGYVIFGMGGALWVLFLGRIVDGLTAGNISTIFAYIADTHAPAERGRIYGLLGAVAGFGFMFGPVAGGFLGALSPTMPLFVAAAITVLCAFWVYIALPESVARDKPPGPWQWRQLNPLGQLAGVLRYANLRVPFFAAFCFFFAGAMLQSNLSVYLKDVLQFGTTSIGWTLFGVGVMDIVSQGLLTRVLLPRLGSRMLTRLGLAINAVGFAMIASLVFVPRIEFLAASIFVFTLGDGLFQPAMSEIIANAAPPDAQGRVQGANQAQQSLARMLGPLAPAILSPMSISAPYWVGGAVAIVGMAALWIRQKATR